MKKFAKVAAIGVAISTLLAVMPLAAQNADAKVQFLSFDVGVAMGVDLSGTKVAGGSNVGINFAVIDNLLIGINALTYGTSGVANASTYAGLRLGYSFMPMLGAAIGFGANTTAAVAKPAVTLGVYSNLFQAKAASGFVYGLGLKIDYLAETDGFDKGKLLFGLGMNFGI
jgi:hypothetical protein